MFSLATISATGLLWFLVYIAVLVCFILILKWLFAKLGWGFGDPIWAVIGLICFLLLLIWFIQGGLGPPVFGR